MEIVGILFSYWVSAGLFSGAIAVSFREGPGIKINHHFLPLLAPKKFRVKARLRLAYNDLTSLDGLQGLGSLEAMGTETFQLAFRACDTVDGEVKSGAESSPVESER